MEYPVFLRGHPVFFEHLAGAHNMSATHKDPPFLTYPGDVTAIGPLVDMPYGDDIGLYQEGKLMIPVTVTFPDGFQQTFPINSKVVIYTNPDEDDMISLAIDIQAQPVPAPVLQQGAGKRKSRCGVRKNRKPRATRRRRAH